jgi:hypothetical protein
MEVGLVYRATAFRKKRLKLPRESVRQLKEISYLSSVKRWEYAGGIEYKAFRFSEPTCRTSKQRGSVEQKDLDDIWHSNITYHTHPGYGGSESVSSNTEIFTTLPSDADFEAYIKGFPWLQSNILCDSHGYYVIDIIKAYDNNTLPLPMAVSEYMRKLRSEPFMRIHAFSDEGYEYFNTTLKNWKQYINYRVRDDMSTLFGISIRYYGYEDDSPIITVLREV